MRTPLPGMVSLCSYLPMACAVTRWSMAAARSRSESPKEVVFSEVNLHSMARTGRHKMMISGMAARAARGI